MVVATRPKPKSSVFVSEPTKREIIEPELERIRLEHGGILMAEDVVSEAEMEDSPLHRFFQWDDTAAAHQYRLWQARHLIITVTVTLTPFTKRTITAYVSLRDDRQSPAGGYRAIVEVLSNADQRAMLLSEALRDLNTFERKYNRLVELAPVFEAVHKIQPKKKK